ncbi:hypothetical protein D915_009014 [Fasciola hepatica]|uniref:Uncharacterized protein n=1 Tax=Fasciola hepatica TaxID=6192 RepID=A0A2H1BX84_FASHE|nr:hypothetical protein D915_009014 [Fasciola hepatica]
MTSVAVQTDLKEDEDTVLDSITMGIFADILSILDDENHKIYYDISESFAYIHSKRSVDADAGNLIQGCLPSLESQQDITEINPEPRPLTTEELEQSVRLSEFRLQTNLAALAEIQNKEDHVKEWIKSTNDATPTGICTPSEGPFSPQIDTTCSFSELPSPCSSTVNTPVMQTNGKKTDLASFTPT